MKWKPDPSGPRLHSPLIIKQTTTTCRVIVAPRREDAHGVKRLAQGTLHRPNKLS